jgi:hypothetical protein
MVSSLRSPAAGETRHFLGAMPPLNGALLHAFRLDPRLAAVGQSMPASRASTRIRYRSYETVDLALVTHVISRRADQAVSAGWMRASTSVFRPVILLARVK